MQLISSSTCALNHAVMLRLNGLETGLVGMEGGQWETQYSFIHMFLINLRTAFGGN